MADTYEIPIKRRHYASTALLEAGGLGLQHWAYDETNEQFGVRLADGTYRYHCRSKVYPPGAGSTYALMVDASSNVGIACDPDYKLDIAYGGVCLNMGGDSEATTRTTDTIKYGVIAAPSFSNDEESVCMLEHVAGGADDTYLRIGGGNSSLNCATNITLYTAAAETTLTGTAGLTITTSRVTVNPSLADVDFRWGADTNLNGFYCDAGMRSGLGSVGVGMAPAILSGTDDIVLQIFGPTESLGIVDVVTGTLGSYSGKALVVSTGGGSPRYYIPLYDVAWL